MQYERRKKYDKIGKTFKDSDFEKTYFSLIVKFDSKQEIDTFKENSLLKSDDHLWALFGKNDEESWVCLQVGATIGSIIEEIESDIVLMKEENEDDAEKEFISVNTQFYENTYEVPKGKARDRRKYRYKKIHNDYEKLAFYSINIDAYLGLEERDDCKIIKEMIAISKMNYAEAKFAFETQAIYWNALRCGIDMKAIKLWI